MYIANETFTSMHGRIYVRGQEISWLRYQLLAAIDKKKFRRPYEFFPAEEAYRQEVMERDEDTSISPSPFPYGDRYRRTKGEDWERINTSLGVNPVVIDDGPGIIISDPPVTTDDGTYPSDWDPHPHEDFSPDPTLPVQDDGSVSPVDSVQQDDGPTYEPATTPDASDSTNSTSYDSGSYDSGSPSDSYSSDSGSNSSSSD